MNHALRRLVGLSLLAAVLTGCNQEPPDQTVFDEPIEALDRAKQVEETLMNRASEMGKRIDDDIEKEDEDPPQ